MTKTESSDRLMTFEFLKSRQRQIRSQFSPALGIRVHRALSWLDRAERETDDLDAQFLFLWIAFNAAYANELPERGQFTEAEVFSNFVKRLVALDRGKLLQKMVWDGFPGPIRLIIENKFVFQPFWDYHNGRLEESVWKERFQTDRARAHRALGRHDTASVLIVILGRLYTLRNQIIHGGATWNSGVNRDQIRNAVHMMEKLVPAIIEIMMDSSGEVWGDPVYPVVD
jgi:hypothetical protein